MKKSKKKDTFKFARGRSRWGSFIPLIAAGIFVLVLVLIGIGLGSISSSKEGKAVATADHKKGDTQKIEKEEKEPSKDEEIEKGTKPPQSENEEIEKETEPPQPENEQSMPAQEAPATEVAANNVMVYAESEGARKAYLTFDDGCSEQTDRILDILNQYGIKATFFVTAQGGEANAARYRRIVAEGHSIGLHSVSHKYSEVYASLDTFIADVENIRQFVLDTTGVDSHLYRFPGGSSNTVSAVPMDDCIRYLNQNGYRYFDWNVDTSDTVNRRQSVEQVLSKVFGTVVDKYHNCVILMHDSALQNITVESLPRIIEGLQARGLEILPITENTPPVQHKKAETVQ